MKFLAQLLAAFVVLIETTTARATEPPSVFKPLQWNELRPATLSFDLIQQDKVSGSHFMDTDGRGLLFSGDRFIWRWNIVDGTVSRVALPDRRQGKMFIVAAEKNFIAAIDQSGAWMFDRKLKNWKRLDGSFDATCKPISASIIPLSEPGKIYFATDCGLFLITTSAGQLVVIGGDELNLSQAGLASLTVIDQNSMAVADGLDIVKVTIDGVRASKKSMYTAKSKVLGVTRSDDHFVAWTSQAIVFFDKQWKRLQVVPVLGRKKIVSFAAGAKQHFVLFVDGAMEVMDIESRQKWSGQNYLGTSLAASGDGQYLILDSAEHVARVFSLTNFK
jgi:hypothetical protein